MQEVSILGVGQTAVAKHENVPLQNLALSASRSALVDAGLSQVDAVFVGNMLASHVTGQSHLGPLLVSSLGGERVEGVTVSAACGSGGAAVRQAYLAVASGAYEVVLAIGVEKMTGVSKDLVTRLLATAADAEREVANGATFVALNALLMRRYMHQYKIPREAFSIFSEVAHQNATTNPNARLQKGMTSEQYFTSRMVSDPISVFDASPIGDGAAAVVLGRRRRAQSGAKVVDLVGSASATDALSIQQRRDPLRLEAAEASVGRALNQAGKTLREIDFFELHDAFTIMAALSLEACGLTPRGTATQFARDEGVHLGGAMPVSTMGGLKARGHPVGATGVYQIVEATLQLRGEAGANQLNSPSVALTQNIGGSGATVITHVLERTA